MGKWNDKCLDDYFDLMHERPNALHRVQFYLLSLTSNECSHS